MIWEYKALLLGLTFTLAFSSIANRDPYLSKEWQDRWFKVSKYTVFAAAVVGVWVWCE